MPKITGGSNITSSSQIAAGAVTSEDILDAEIINADISASAGIQHSKMESDARARANHTGTQLASTISDFATAVDAEVNASALLEASGEEVNITNTTAETNILSVSIPANTLGTNRAVRAKIYINGARFFSGASILTLRLKYGATTVATIGIDPSAATGGGHKGYVEAILFANAATNAQSGFLRYWMAVDQLDPAKLTAEIATWGVGVGTAIEDSTGALNLIVSAQWANADLDNDFQRRGYIVEKLA